MTQITGLFGHWMPQKTSIRYACPKADFARLLSIERASFNDPLDDVDLLNLMRSPNTTLVVEHAETVAGFIIFRSDIETQSVDVLNIAVAVGMRRQGLGSKLICQAGLFAARRSLDVKQIRIALPERSVTEQIWLRGLGFRCVGTVHGVEPDGSDRYQFVMEI